MAIPAQTLRGILMICAGSLCFTLNDTITKFLIDDYHVTIIIFVRSIMAMPLLIVMAIVLGRSRVRWSPAILLYTIRGAIGLLAAWMYIVALETLSVAEATVIVFASPFIITGASVLFFREYVPWQKWAAVSVAFCGVVVAIQPGAVSFQPASLLILACAFLYASLSLSARWLPAEDNLWTVSFYGAAFSALFVAPLTLGNWTGIDPADLLLFGGAALCSSFGIGLGSLAYRSTPASDLAPFGFSGLIWATLITWAVWGAFPGFWTILGALIIVSSSLFHLLSSRSRP